MKKLCWLLCLFFSWPALGQELIRQTKKLAPPYSKEVFYVLASDHKVKSGAYTRYFKNKKVAEQGQYEANQRVGTWRYYNPQGTVEQQYNWSTKSFEAAQPFISIHTCWVEENGVFIDKEPQERPILLGGDPLLNQYIITNLRYPPAALRSGIAGLVFISATITPEGKITDEQVEKGLGYGLGEEALRAFKTIAGEWIPGKVNGKPVHTRILWSLRFGPQ